MPPLHGQWHTEPHGSSQGSDALFLILYPLQKLHQTQPRDAIPVCFRLSFPCLILQALALFLFFFHRRWGISLDKDPVNTNVYGIFLNVISLTLYSPSRARTYNNSVNSRVLYHWAIEESWGLYPQNRTLNLSIFWLPFSLCTLVKLSID